MVENRELPNDVQAEAEPRGPESVDIGRRDALKGIGALAGAAPAVAMLLSPSVSRAQTSGGSPCEDCGSGHGPAPGWTPSDTGAPGGNSGLLGRQS